MTIPCSSSPPLRWPLVALLVLAMHGAAGADSAADIAPEARGLVDKWLKAQNDGDFTGYVSLYAARFTGVRRSGARTVRLDRDGWMKDRGRMFQKKMEVAAEDVKIAATPLAARVLLVQRFKQGSYQDVGPKQLVIVREGGAARIAREEMLQSEIVRPGVPTGAAGARDGQQLVLVTPQGLVLSSSPDEAWGRGRRSVDLGDPVVVTQAVEPKKLPGALAAWAGRPVRLHTAAGKSCDATVTGFKLMSRVIPHFGTRQEWEQKKRGEIADEAWNLAAGGRVLVGELSKPCPNAVFARAASLAAPPAAMAADADAKLRQQALKALRALAPWQSTQKSYKSDSGGKGNWDEHEGASPAVKVFRLTPAGRPARTFVSATATVAGSCGEFNGDLWALWELVGDKLVLRNAPGTISIVPVLAVDADGDGDPELLYERATEFDNQGGVVRPQGGVWNDVEKLAVPYLDCPC